MVMSVGFFCVLFCFGVFFIAPARSAAGARAAFGNRRRGMRQNGVSVTGAHWNTRLLAAINAVGAGREECARTGVGGSPAKTKVLLASRGVDGHGDAPVLRG